MSECDFSFLLNWVKTWLRGVTWLIVDCVSFFLAISAPKLSSSPGSVTYTLQNIVLFPGVYVRQKSLFPIRLMNPVQITSYFRYLKKFVNHIIIKK